MIRTTVRALRVVLVLFCFLMIILGCDQDKQTTAPDPATTTTSSDSTLVSTLVGDRMMDAPFQTIDLSAQLLAAVPGMGPAGRLAGQAAGASVTEGDNLIITAVLSYSYAYGWHIFAFEAVAVDHTRRDTVDIAGTDSVRVLVDGLPVQAVDDTLAIDGILARAHLTWSKRSADGFGALHHALDVLVQPTGTDTLVRIDGSAHDSLWGTSVSETERCMLDLTYDMVITDLAIRIPETAGDCPESGDLEVAVGIDARCVGTTGTPPDSAAIHGTWTVNAHVNDDNTVAVTFGNGLLFWRTTTSCDDSNGSSEVHSGWWTSTMRSTEAD